MKHAILLLMLPLCLAVGCSSRPRTAAVTGEVKFQDGKALPDGIIRFISLGGDAASPAFAVIAEGRYALPKDKGPVVGNHRVEITAFQLSDEVEFMEEAGKKVEIREKEQYLPARYNVDSQLTAVIEPGDNVANFTLELP